MSRPIDFVNTWWRTLHDLANEYHCRPSDLVFGSWGALNWDLAVLARVQEERRFLEEQKRLAKLRELGKEID